MNKHVVAVIFVFILDIGCTQHHNTPEFTAKLFVRDYFLAEGRSHVLKYTSGNANKKIISENEYFNDQKLQKVEIERPSLFLLTDSISMDLNSIQFTFSICYESNILTTQNMFVTMIKDNDTWNVSDYHFAGQENYDLR
ncbi:hypothetical protein F9K33_03955 [bacterium]|nr:MAG: hypothetical protein F9K33_03955 [bacterium]